MVYFDKYGYVLHNAGKSWSYSASSSLMRFEVRLGDYGLYGAPGTERSEIAATSHTLKFGSTYTIKYKFMVEPGLKNTADWLVMGQLHQTEDPGEGGAPPPFSIELAGEKMRIVGRYTQEAITKSPVQMSLYTDSFDIKRGHWYDMKIVVKFDPNGNGSLDVWRDAIKLVDYNGPLGYPDKIGPYWKYGIYRESSPETIAIDYFNFSLVKNSSGTAPTPPPKPKPPVAALSEPLPEASQDQDGADGNTLSASLSDDAFNFATGLSTQKNGAWNAGPNMQSGGLESPALPELAGATDTIGSGSGVEGAPLHSKDFDATHAHYFVI